MKSQTQPGAIRPSQVPFSRRVHISLVNSREWVPPREQHLRAHTGHLHVWNAVSYFMACFFQLLVCPWYIYHEGWKIYWYGRFISTFNPGYAFVALVAGAIAGLTLHYVPTEMLTLLAVHFYTSLAMAISVGHLSRKQRNRFLTYWNTAQLASKRSTDKDPLTLAELAAGVNLDDHEALLLTPDLLTTLYERDGMAAVVRRHKEVEQELLAVEREESDAKTYESSPAVRLSPRGPSALAGGGTSELVYQPNAANGATAAPPRFGAAYQEHGSEGQSAPADGMPCPPEGCDVPDVIREVSVDGSKSGYGVSTPPSRSAGGLGPSRAGSHLRAKATDPAHFLAKSSRGSSLGEESSATGTSTGHSRPSSQAVGISEGALRRGPGASGNSGAGESKESKGSKGGTGGGVKGANAAIGHREKEKHYPMRRDSLIRRLVDARIGVLSVTSPTDGTGSSPGSPAVERRFKHLSRPATAAAFEKDGNASDASDESRIRSETSTGSMDSVSHMVQHMDGDELDEDEGAIRGQTRVVGGGARATPFLRYTFRAFVRCLQAEAQEAMQVKKRRKERKLARRRRRILQSTRQMSSVMSVGASTVGRLMAPPPQAEALKSLQTIDDVSSGEESDASDDAKGRIENAFERDESDLAVWKERTPAFAWVLPARVVMEEVIQRASTGASISETDLRVAQMFAIIVLLLPGIEFALPGGVDKYSAGVLLWQRLLLFAIACFGKYNELFVCLRFIIRMVARARRKRELVNSIACMMEYGLALDARLPFFDMRLPRNVRSWAAMLDVLHNYDRYDSVNAAAPMSAFLAQSTILMFILALATVLVAAGVFVVEASSFAVMVAFLVLSGFGSIFTLYIEAGTNFRLLKISQRLAQLRGKMQADLASCSAAFGRIEGYGLPQMTGAPSSESYGAGFVTTTSRSSQSDIHGSTGLVGPGSQDTSLIRGLSHHMKPGMHSGGMQGGVYVVRQPSGVSQGAMSVEMMSSGMQSQPRMSDATQHSATSTPQQAKGNGGEEGATGNPGKLPYDAPASDQLPIDSTRAKEHKTGLGSAALSAGLQQALLQPGVDRSGGTLRPPQRVGGPFAQPPAPPGEIRSASSSEAQQSSSGSPVVKRRVRVVSAGDALRESSASHSLGSGGGSGSRGSGSAGGSGVGSADTSGSIPGSATGLANGDSKQKEPTVVGNLRQVAGLDQSQERGVAWGDGQEYPASGATTIPRIKVPSVQFDVQHHGPMLGDQTAAMGIGGHPKESADASNGSTSKDAGYARRIERLRQEKATLRQMLRASVDLVEARSVEIALGGMYTRLFGGVVIDFTLLRGIVGLISGAALSVVTLLLQDDSSVLSSIA